jgi:N4-gp56 family major capsid protein
MAYSWDFDAPTGVFKNNQLSSELYETALENSVAMPYVDVEQSFGKNKGDTFNITRFTHIAEPTSAALGELQPIPEVSISLSTSAITVGEYGIAVPYTTKLEMLARYNIENAVQRTLMEQKRLVLDSLALTQFKSTNVKYVPTAATTGSITYNGTASGTAVADLSYFHIEDISQNGYDDLRIPYWDGDMYMGIFRSKTVTSIRRDSQFIAWHQYGNPGVKAKGEVGVIERIKLIETNHAAAGALPNVGSNNFGPGVVFGRDAVMMLEVETPHLRAALPTGYGRFKGIAWFGLFGFGLIYSGATTQATSRGVSRVIHVTSA